MLYIKTYSIRRHCREIYKYQSFIKGFLGLKLKHFKCITSQQYEIIKKYLVHKLKKRYTICLRIQYSSIQTEKSIGARMGHGSGSTYVKTYSISQGKLFLEFYGKTLQYIKKILIKLKAKFGLSFGIKRRLFFFKKT